MFLYSKSRREGRLRADSVFNNAAEFEERKELVLSVLLRLTLNVDVVDHNLNASRAILRYTHDCLYLLSWFTSIISYFTCLSESPFSTSLSTGEDEGGYARRKQVRSEEVWVEAMVK